MNIECKILDKFPNIKATWKKQEEFLATAKTTKTSKDLLMPLWAGKTCDVLMKGQQVNPILLQRRSVRF